MIITLCSSASFYRELLDVQKRLQDLGHEVLIPLTAEKMRASGNFDEMQYKTWYANPDDFDQKTLLMKAHLKEVERGDAVLVINLEKKGMTGYVGGNVLLEMFHGWTHEKPLYLLNPVSIDLPLYEEVMGMGPVCLNSDLSQIV